MLQWLKRKLSQVCRPQFCSSCAAWRCNREGSFLSHECWGLPLDVSTIAASTHHHITQQRDLEYIRKPFSTQAFDLFVSFELAPQVLEAAVFSARGSLRHPLPAPPEAFPALLFCLLQLKEASFFWTLSHLSYTASYRTYLSAGLLSRAPCGGSCLARD